MEEELLDRYAEVATQIEANPADAQLHQQLLQILTELNLEQEFADAYANYAQHLVIPTSQALLRLQQLTQKLDQEPQSHLQLIQFYQESLLNYLSIPLLVQYSQHFINNYYAANAIPTPNAPESTADPILAAIYSIESTRTARDNALALGERHLTQSTELWNVWRDFELALLQLGTIPDQYQQVEKLYLARLKVPHLNIEDTFSAYSSLVTQYDNANYETSLSAANKIYAPTRKVVDVREPKEAELKKAEYADWAYLNYIRWELEVKRPAIDLVKTLFERAINDHPANVEIWDAFLEYSMGLPKAISNLQTLGERSIKNCPGSGLLWATYLRIAEKLQLGPDAVEELFERAMTSRQLDGHLEDLIKIYEARADFHRREVDTLLVDADEIDPGMIDLVAAILLEGIKKLKSIKGGDPQLRLDKYLIRMYERFGRLEEASDVWERLSNDFSRSYAVWYGRADFETRAGNFKSAHEIYVKGCSAKYLDYPDYLLEMWLAFEHQNGTLTDLEFAITKVKRQRRGLEAKRLREAQAAGQSTSAVAQPTTDSMDVDNFLDSIVEDTSAASKRSREEVVESTGPTAKKPKVESAQSTIAAVATPAVPEEQKRDRENSTIFVICSSEANMTEDDLKSLFSDCGKVRELKLKTIGSENLAMLEFMEKESVLPARTKDKKRINGVELDVHVAWKSCLYVTNFPESFDKAQVEEMFSKFGTIFDTRWPSKRFKNTRRFCYVQFTTSASAEAALSLHNTELEPDVKLVVYISDPGKKKGRTDAGVNDRELYIAGLSKFVKEIDLRRLFEPFGTIKALRILLDENQECKGSAFVEYEDQAAAVASLSLNNHELKKRRMSVTVAQKRVAGTHKLAEGSKGRNVDIESRSLRVRGIPPGTEEPIVQQAFEKFAKVRIVAMEPGASEALIEFENAAEAGKALLAKDSIKIDDIDLEIFVEGPQARTIDGKKPTSLASTSTSTRGGAGGEMSLMPRQASRGRGRIGLRGTRRGIGARGGSVSVGNESSMTGTSGEAAGRTSAAAGGSGSKSQDDFRALLSKK